MSDERGDTMTNNSQVRITPQTDNASAIAFFSHLLRNILANIAAVVAILTVLGFAIVQGYLLSVTDLMLLNVDVRLYLIAGGNMLFSLPNAFHPTVIEGLLPAAIIVCLFIIVEFAFRRQGIDKIDGNENVLVRTLVAITRGYRDFARLTIAFIAIVVLLTVAVGYGFFSYGQSPRVWGGGEPSTIILVFNEPQDDAGWPFAINPAYPRQTEPIEMLMQLTDGVLVRDPQNPVPVIVKADIIRAIIDASTERQPPPTATPTATPALPTATP